MLTTSKSHLAPFAYTVKRLLRTPTPLQHRPVNFYSTVEDHQMALAAQFKLKEGPVDWQDYNSRWNKIWSDGLNPGQVRVKLGK